VQAIDLTSVSAGLQRFCPAPGGGWFVLGHNEKYESLVGAAVLQVTEDSDVAWRRKGIETRDFLDRAATADGGLVVDPRQRCRTSPRPNGSCDMSKLRPEPTDIVAIRGPPELFESVQVEPAPWDQHDEPPADYRAA
jgi:hypothetical protein